MLIGQLEHSHSLHPCVCVPALFFLLASNKTNNESDCVAVLRCPPPLHATQTNVYTRFNAIQLFLSQQTNEAIYIHALCFPFKEIEIQSSENRRMADAGGGHNWGTAINRTHSFLTECTIDNRQRSPKVMGNGLDIKMSGKITILHFARTQMSG